jgi:hypothetical protein
MVVVSPAEKSKLPKGAAKSTSSSSSSVDHSEFNVGGATDDAGEKSKLPKGAAKSTSGSSSNLDLPAIDVGWRPSPPGVRPGAGLSAAVLASRKDEVNWVPRR